MENYQALREEIVSSAQELTRKGYLMATGGNVSVRASDKSGFAITPSNYDYMKMKPADVCVLDMDLNILAGERKPSVEAGMHCAIYLARPDVNVIVHTHQVYASTLTLIQAPIPALFDEQARFLGRSVEIIPYAPSGTGFLSSTVAKYVRGHNNAFLMQNHGTLVFGTNMERAIHNVEILEKCSLAYLIALCSEKKVTRIPAAIREIALIKLKKDQQRVIKGEPHNSSE
ncbi:MAG: class II aldolase/adducin family protein [Anaerolineae bacterium]|nr:class II aldolase/adducin family protein [Anaerolineae bacterium]